MTRFLPKALCAVCTAVFLAGCGGAANTYDAVVTGTVTIDGELAKSGTVIFYPVKEDGLVATSQVFPDGSYSLRTGQGDLSNVDGGTVQSGDYVVTVSITGPPAPGAVVAEGGPPVPGPSLIAEKYALKDTTDLKFTVKPGPNVFVLELDAAEPVEAGEQESPAEGEDRASDETAVESAESTDAASEATDQAAVQDSESESGVEAATPAEQPKETEVK